MMSASALLILFLSSVSALTVPVAALDRRAILGRFASAATAVVALPALAITPPGTPSLYACFPSTYTSHCLIEGTSHCTLFKFDRHRGLFKFYARLPPDICRRVQRPAAPWLQAQYQARREPGKRPSRCISSCFFSLPTHTAFSVFGLAQIAAICMPCPHDPQAIVYSPFLDEQAIIRGADEDGTPWKVTGKVSGSEMIVDFSPKGGPKAVPAKWNGLGIQFPGRSPPPLLREPYPPPAHPLPTPPCPSPAHPPPAHPLPTPPCPSPAHPLLPIPCPPPSAHPVPTQYIGRPSHPHRPFPHPADICRRQRVDQG